jgi:hypothetical protein
MAIVKTAATVTQADLNVAGTLIDAAGNIVSTSAEAKYIVALEQGKPTITPIASNTSSSQSLQDAQIAKRVEVLPSVATEADLLTLTFGTAVDSGQVGPGDEVPVGSGVNTKWFKFSGSSQANVASKDFWKEITPTVAGGGRVVGTSSTFATLPTTFESAGVKVNDVAFLDTANKGTGTDASPQYPRGWYRYDGTKYVVNIQETAASAASETVTLASLPADTWTAVTSTMSNVRDSAITDSSGNVVTQSIMRRIVSGKLELRSTDAMSSLTITLFS